MSNDPFASAPAQDEAQQENTTPTIQTSKEKPLTTATVSDQSKITLTFKGGSGFDAPWTVVHANNPTEAKEIILDEDFKELLKLVQQVGGAFVGMAPDKPAAPAGNGQPAGANQAPGGETPPPGYVFKSGMGKNGKPWKAFMPIDRNSGLEVQWLR